MSDINEPLCPRCAGTAEVTRKRTIVSGGRGEDSAGSLSPAETVTLEHLQRMHRWGGQALAPGCHSPRGGPSSTPRVGSSRLWSMDRRAS